MFLKIRNKGKEDLVVGYQMTLYSGFLYVTLIYPVSILLPLYYYMDFETLNFIIFFSITKVMCAQYRKPGEYSNHRRK